MKKSQIDKAIEQLQGEVNVLVLAISKLQQQQVAKPKAKRGPRAVPGTDAKQAAS